MKNSPNKPEKNFLAINKSIKTTKKPKKDVLCAQHKKEVLENFEFNIKESKISKNIKNVLEMVHIFIFV